MPPLPSPWSAVPSVVVAALLLAAGPLLDALGLPHPSADQILAATGAGRSRAYELRRAVEQIVPTVLRPPGRPAKVAPPTPDPTRAEEILRSVRDYLLDHGGAVGGTGARRRYSDGFRHFVLDLAARFRDVSLEGLADLVAVPLPTLKDWLAGGADALTPPESLVGAAPRNREPTDPQIQTVLAVWATWDGAFTAFCRHVQHDWRVPFGRTLIAGILEAHGVRWAKRRTGRSPDEDAIRGAFQTWFPNAQWVADGAAVDVVVGGDTFRFNLELVVDPASGAFVGASVDDVEDGQALISAFDDGVQTTGAQPLALLVDNKPSNLTDEVREAVADAAVLPATPFRPQNKAHVEGAFGLFQQTIPDLVLPEGPPREVARALLAVAFVVFGRVLNHRPRDDRRGRSRVQLHLDHPPTAEQMAAARAALQERIRLRDAARETRQARTDPLVRAVLRDAFARFGFADPSGALLDGIARYPIDAVLEGIAIVEGKRNAGTLPEGVDARYLLGCVRNVAEEREGWEIALALWQERVRARDAALAAAEREQERLDERLDAAIDRIPAYVDRALRTTRRLDRFFWLKAVVDVIQAEDETEHERLFRLAARRIHATHSVPHRERLSATRFLAAELLPVG